MTYTYFGVDIHKLTYQVAILKSGDVEDITLETTTNGKQRLVEFIREAGPTKIAMEACTGSYHLYDILSRNCPQATIYILDGRKLRERFPKKGRKTDKIDALNLAKAASYPDIESIWIPDETVRRQRRISANRCHILDQETEEKNRLHSALREHGIRLPFSSGRLWSQLGRAWLEQRLPELYPELKQEILFGLQRLDIIQAQLRQLETQIAQWAIDSPEAKLLLSIPGIGPTGAFTIVAEMGDPERFESSRQVTRAAGLDPKVNQSGASCYHGSVSKRGRSRLRWIAVECALSSRRFCPRLKSFYARILKRTRSGSKAKVATGRKLLTLCWFVLKSKRPYNDQQEKLTESKLKRAEAVAKRETGRVPRKRKLPKELDLAT